jgi:predicted NUDIX family NTP pyrophosphohydrolase
MKQSAGILVYKKAAGEILFFLVHPGGPYWKNKDMESWSIPKGEFTSEEEPLNAAIREFEEETGISLEGEFGTLSPVKLKSGKTVFAWFIEKDINPTAILSNTFEIEWPPKSGLMKQFPEIDRAAWFPAALAIQKINPAQAAFLHELSSKLTSL